MRARIKSMQRILALKILTAPGVGGENCSSHHRTIIRTRLAKMFIATAFLNKKLSGYVFTMKEFAN